MRANIDDHTTLNLKWSAPFWGAFVLGTVVLAVLASGIAAADVVGKARVVDGDTIEVAGTRIRLEGIDAPERAQRCPGRWFGSWACGKRATNWLKRKVERRQVRCRSTGRDKYARTLGVCYVDGQDVNRQMILNGYAWAFRKYSKRYVVEERAAKKDFLGVWSSLRRGRAPQSPWHYRKSRWAGASQQAPEGCAIKGNISNKGRIYHPPWSPWYARVRISEQSGERWFCSEKEALEAGWRAVVVR